MEGLNIRCPTPEYTQAVVVSVYLIMLQISNLVVEKARTVHEKIKFSQLIP